MPTIRQARQDDAPAVAPLFDAYRQFYGRASDPALAHAFISERLQRDESVIFLAEDGAGASGFVQLYPSFTSLSGARIWILNDLFVAASGRRQGAATALLTAAVEFSRQSGAVKLCLSTAQDNHSAQALYEGLGWRHMICSGPMNWPAAED